MPTLHWFAQPQHDFITYVNINGILGGRQIAGCALASFPELMRRPSGHTRACVPARLPI